MEEVRLKKFPQNDTVGQGKGQGLEASEREITRGSSKLIWSKDQKGHLEKGQALIGPPLSEGGNFLHGSVVNRLSLLTKLVVGDERLNTMPGMPGNFLANRIESLMLVKIKMEQLAITNSRPQEFAFTVHNVTYIFKGMQWPIDVRG